MRVSDSHRNGGASFEALNRSHDLRGPAESVLLEVSSRISERIATATDVAVSGTTPRAYIVGGWCRDKVLGARSLDIDMEVFGLDQRNLVHALKSLGYQVVEPKEMGTTPVKVILGESGFIDITIPMREVAPSERAVGYVTDPSLSLTQAGERRDFTINSIYFDPVTQSYVDPFGGIEDLARSSLKLVPGRTTATVNPGMPLRACRLAAQLGLTMEPHTLEVIQDAVAHGVLEKATPQLLTKEFEKMLLCSHTPSAAIRLADSLGILAKIVPQLSALKDVRQSKQHHPEGSVFEHTMMVVDAAAKLSLHLAPQERLKVMWAALLHDVGKLTTTAFSMKDGVEKISAHGHEKESARIAFSELRKFSYCHQTRSQISKLAAYHMKPLEMLGRWGESPSSDSFDNSVRQLIRGLHPCSLDSFLTLCRADQAGRLRSSHSSTTEPILDRIEVVARDRDYIANPTARLLYGTQLKELGFDEERVSYRQLIEEVELLRDQGRLRTEDDAKRHLLVRHALPAELVSSLGNEKKHFFLQFKAAISQGYVASVQDAIGFTANYSTLRNS